MNAKRKIEIFSAGCPVCDETIEMVKRNTCQHCEVTVLDMNDADVADRAKTICVGSVPAVVIDGKLADCCAGRGPDETILKAAGLGQPYSNDNPHSLRMALHLFMDFLLVHTFYPIE